MFACNGILFNHESPVRGETFVTRKITMALTQIMLGLRNFLFLGNLEAKRDWGHAKDYVEAQWLILQQQEPEDFVISTGKQFSVRDFINQVCIELNLKLEWKGNGLNEIGYINGKETIKIDPRYYRPTEVETLLGDSTKAKNKLKWKPKITFKELVSEMVSHDLLLARKELAIKNFK
jgi:GDPmannose 4,6-dehydratase